MSEIYERGNFEGLRDLVTQRLVDLGAPVSEFPTARAHILGGNVAWYFGDTTRKRPQWLFSGPTMQRRTADGRLAPTTKIEWYATLLAVLNSLIDSDFESKEWWLYREKANSLYGHIQEVERGKKASRRHARKNKGRVGPLKLAIKIIAAQCEGLSARKVIEAMKIESDNLDLYERAYDPLPIKIKCVRDKVYYQDRAGQSKSVSFGRIENIVTELRKEQNA